MANPEHLEWLREGTEAWRQRWLKLHSTGAVADLSEADLSGTDLSGTFLSQTNLHEANLSWSNLCETNLRWSNLHKSDLSFAALARATLREADLNAANLSHVNAMEANFQLATLCEANLYEALLVRANFHSANLNGANLCKANLNDADLRYAILRGVDLRDAELTWANLAGTDLTGADLSGADLEGARLVKANLRHAVLTGCRVYGISAWDLQLDEHTNQDNLLVTPHGEPEVSVDNLEVAQFVYLLLTNAKIRDVIDTIGRKAVLILGRFTPERKAILDAIRQALRARDYVPILFDFEGPESLDLIETVSTLAHLSRFVIADITDAAAVREELLVVAPRLPSVPIQPLLLEGAKEYATFEHPKRFPSMLPIYRYRDVEALLAALDEHVIAPAAVKAEQLAPQNR
jgi:uncharacterized protein YjbI with pentapeptide repeats